MRKYQLLFLILTSCVSVFSQESLRMNIQLSEMPYYRFHKIDGEGTAIWSNFTSAGIGLETNTQSYRMTYAILYGLNLNLTVFESNFPIFQSHLLGISYKFHLKKENSLFVGISLFSEVASNYKGNTMWNEFIPYTPVLYNLEYLGHGVPSKLVLQSNFYQSTPFIGFVHAGYNFKVTQAFHISLSASYGFQIMKYKYLKWDEGVEYQEALRLAPVQTQLFHAIGVELGLSYSIPMRSDRKSKE
ncbi:MAG: hypothetical protein M9897_09520 [Brumimicrobium sp.]|nr:hypothetical protein [Brumimicrobium sp.]